MKTKIILIATIALFALGGCKTVKQTETAKQTTTTDVTVNQSSEQNNDIKLKVDSSKLTVDKGQVSEAITEETVTIVYAPRDSTGKQAIFSVTTTKRGIDRTEIKNLQENKQNSKQLTDKSDSKSEARVVASSKTKSKETTKKQERYEPDGWVVFFMFLVGAILIIRVFKPFWLTDAFKWLLNHFKK